jgi:glycosyltransferase involved in cell wall biosynthesis
VQSHIFLSFVLTTRNKFPFLKEILDDLVLHKECDEEIIVIDSGSSDGTVEYLKRMMFDRKVDYFVSEPDEGEAHGFNKGIVQARGKYIKLLSDDDVFDWHRIRGIKHWLFENSVSLVFSNGLGNTKHDKVVSLAYEEDFMEWTKYGNAFAFCGLGLFIRRDALPLIGYLNPVFKRVDAEYSLRATSCRNIKIAFSHDYLWFRRLNPNSNSAKFSKTIGLEMAKLLLFYGSPMSLIKWIHRRYIRNIKIPGGIPRLQLKGNSKGTPCYVECGELLDKANQNRSIYYSSPKCGQRGMTSRENGG